MAVDQSYVARHPQVFIASGAARGSKRVSNISFNKRSSISKDHDISTQRRRSNDDVSRMVGAEEDYSEVWEASLDASNKFADYVSKPRYQQRLTQKSKPNPKKPTQIGALSAANC